MDRVTKDVDYLQSLSAVRQRSAEVYELAKQGKLDNWSLHEDKYVNIVAYCSDLMKVSVATWCLLIHSALARR